MSLEETNFFIAEMPFIFKNILLKDLNAKQILTIYSANNDNMIDNDLKIRFIDKIGNEKLIDCELKFGHETVKNIGKNIFLNILDNNNVKIVFSVFLENIKKTQRNIKEKLFSSNETIDNIIKKLELSLVANVEKFVKNNQETINVNARFIQKLLLSGGHISTDGKKKELIKYNIAFNSITKEIDIKNITLKPEELLFSELNIFKSSTNNRVVLLGTNNYYSLRVILNWKNTYKDLNNIKWKAKLGLGTSSWNIFLKKLQ